MSGITRVTRVTDIKTLTRRCKILIGRELRGDANAYDVSEISALRRVVGELLPIVEQRTGHQMHGREECEEILDDAAAFAYGNPVGSTTGHWVSVYDDEDSRDHAWLDVSTSKRERDDGDGTRAVRLNIQQATAIRNSLDSFIADRNQK